MFSFLHLKEKERINILRTYNIPVPMPGVYIIFEEKQLKARNFANRKRLQFHNVSSVLTHRLADLHCIPHVCYKRQLLSLENVRTYGGSPQLISLFYNILFYIRGEIPLKRL